jgi:protein phosphatase
MFGEVESERRPIRLPTLLLHPLKAAPPEDTHFEPEREEFLELLIEEDRRRARRRRARWLLGLVVAILALVAAAVAGYQWTQSRYFVGLDERGKVAIFQGVQQNLGPIPLSHVVQTSEIDPADLPGFERGQVERTINADGFQDAYRILDRLANLADSGAVDP